MKGPLLLAASVVALILGVTGVQGKIRSTGFVYLFIFLEEGEGVIQT